MKFEEYRKKAYSAIQKHDSLKDAMSHWTIGLTEEAGEVNGVIKHALYNCENIPAVRLAEELGDVLWYVAALCTEAGINMDTLAELNLAKNAHKYPSGCFDAARSAARHEDYKQFQTTVEYKELLGKLFNLEQGE